MLQYTFMLLLCLGCVLFGWLSAVYVVFPARTLYSHLLRLNTSDVRQARDCVHVRDVMTGARPMLNVISFQQYRLGTALLFGVG